MTASRPISPAGARRYLVLHHRLAPPRALPPEPASVMAVIERLGSLQFDPLEVAGRNHDLVLLARIAGYRRELTDGLLYRERILFEAYNKGLSILPTAELPFYRVSWDRARAAHEGGAFDDHAPLVEELVEQIRRDGPLSPTDVAPRAAIDWYWRPTNQVRAILEALAEAGILGIRERDGNRRIYDLAERLFPAELLAERRPARDQRRHKLLSRYRAHGLLGRSGSAELWSGTAPGKATAAIPFSRGELLAELVEAGELVPVTIDGLRGERFVPRSGIGLLEQAVAEVEAEAASGAIDADGGRTWTIGRPGGHDPGVAFLAPLDPSVWDREFLRALHSFDYVWEVYVPAAKRRWGYYVLPILYGDALVGRIEPRIERRSRRLRIAGLWWEAGFDPLADPRFGRAFVAAIEAHLAFGGLDGVVWPRTARHKPFIRELRALGGLRTGTDPG